MVAKTLWVLSVLSLVMAWVASTRADGTYCLKARDANGGCPSGIPVAHFFLDSLSLGVLALGLGGACGKRDCSDMSCGEKEE